MEYVFFGGGHKYIKGVHQKSNVSKIHMDIVKLGNFGTNGIYMGQSTNQYGLPLNLSIICISMER